MAFTPNFDQPGNTEVQEYLEEQKFLAKRRIADQAVNLIDQELLGGTQYNGDAKRFRIHIEGDFMAADELIRAVYIGVGWSEVTFASHDIGSSRDPVIETIITLVK